MAVVIEHDGHVREPGAGDAHSNRIVSVGAPLNGYEITIRDDNGDLLPEWRLGEICVKGDCVTSGYYRNPEATAHKLDGQVLKTGDLGFIVDGELFFVARRDDIVNIGGLNICPDDVESVVESLEFLGPGRACLIAVEDGASGLTKPVLLAEASVRLASELAAVWKSRIQRTVLEQLGLLIGTVVLCAKGTIEKTSSGKKRRKVILQRYLDGTIREVSDERERVAAL